MPLSRLLTRPLQFLALAALIAGCSAEVLQTVPMAPPEGAAAEAPLRVRFASVEVVEVTLPSYAENEEIYVRGADGALTAYGPLWADAPARAVTLQLARELGAATTARTAPEPWPFRSIPDARVDVRIEEFIATDTGRFVIAGQYFVAPDSGTGERAARFGIDVPVTDASAAGIAAARSIAVARLAAEIARSGLR